MADAPELLPDIIDKLSEFGYDEAKEK